MTIYDATFLPDGTVLSNRQVWRWLDRLGLMLSGDPAPIAALEALWTVLHWLDRGEADPRADFTEAGRERCRLLAVHGVLVAGPTGDWHYDAHLLALLRAMDEQQHMRRSLRMGLRAGSFNRASVTLTAPAWSTLTGAVQLARDVPAADEDDDDEEDYWYGI